MGLTTPVLIMAMAMGIEVGDWAAVEVQLQRTADAAAIAGVVYYNSNSGLANLAQNAATHAAKVAQLNGASGTSSPTWTAGTQTLADNQITVQIVSGVRSASDTAVKATVSQTVSLAIGRIFTSNPAITLSASAVAEIIVSTTGPQPCILGLNGDQNGVTTDIDVALTGNANIDANSCAVRSDGAVTLSGNATINASGTYAAGSISTSGNSQITGGKYASAGQIADPYASDTTLQTALTTAASSSVANAQTVRLTGGSQTLQPGSYSSISASGQAHLTLAPGLYYVNGNISLSGQSTLSASSVTIVSAGTLDLSGGSVSSFTAPTISDSTATGGIPGVLYASSSSSSSSFTGSAAVPFTGLVYSPNGVVRFTGNATDGTTGCSEVIAGTVTLTGNANLGANCSLYGTLTFGSSLTYSAALVE